MIQFLLLSLLTFLSLNFAGEFSVKNLALPEFFLPLITFLLLAPGLALLSGKKLQGLPVFLLIFLLSLKQSEVYLGMIPIESIRLTFLFTSSLLLLYRFQPKKEEILKKITVNKGFMRNYFHLLFRCPALWLFLAGLPLCAQFVTLLNPVFIKILPPDLPFFSANSLSAIAGALILIPGRRP